MRRRCCLKSLLTLSFLQQIVAPVRQVKHGENGGKCHTANDINFLGSWRKLVQPNLKKVIVSLWLHVDFTVMQFVHLRTSYGTATHGTNAHGASHCSARRSSGRRGRRRGSVWSPHHGLLKNCNVRSSSMPRLPLERPLKWLWLGKIL